MHDRSVRSQQDRGRLGDLGQDLRQAVRLFRMQPGFAATSILTLALGIGATTALFSVVYSVMLRPLPFYQPEQLVNLAHRSPDGGRNQGPATYFTYRANQRVFEGIGAWDRGEATITGRGNAERVKVLSVDDAVLPLLRVQPMHGRLFRQEDTAPGTSLTVLLTYGYWQARFGGARNAVGEALSIDGAPADVIGVLPPSFKFPGSDGAVLLLPLQLNPGDATQVSFGFQALARLRPGVTIAQANADVARMISLLPSGVLQRLQPDVRSQTDYVIGDVGELLWILFAAVGVVLLMACGNVANLFLVRAETRQQDVALRAALGATRGRLARAMLTESCLLALCGGAVGLILAKGSIEVLQKLAPAELPRLDEIGVHPAVMLFALGIAVLNGAVFGLVGVLNFTRSRVIDLKEGGRSASDGPLRQGARNTLVVSQIALALVLLIVSGLLVRTVVELRQVHPGFVNPETVQTFRISIPATLISDTGETVRTFENILRRIEQVPGVRSAGLSSSITMDGEDNGNSIELEDFPQPVGSDPPLYRFKSVAPRYLETMGIPVVAGRGITWADIHDGRPVAVISETLARKYWQTPERALGERIRTAPTRPWRDIIGVIGNERDDGLDKPETPIVYFPLLNGYPRRTIAYAVRSDRVGTTAFNRELERAVWSVNTDLPLTAVETLQEIQGRSMARTSFAMVMLGIAAAVSLLLAIVGIFGVISYVVARRTREIGIRMALGAHMGDVRQMFLGQGLRLTGAGIVIGMVAAFMLSRVLATLLFGVTPTDPLTYIALAVALGALALLATYLPTRRAARIDPIVALRAER